MIAAEMVVGLVPLLASMGPHPGVALLPIEDPAFSRSLLLATPQSPAGSELRRTRQLSSIITECLSLLQLGSRGAFGDPAKISTAAEYYVFHTKYSMFSVTISVRQLSCQEVQMHNLAYSAQPAQQASRVCREARKAGHTVTAVSRRTDPLPLPDDPSLNTVCADAVTGTGVAEAVAGSDAVISSLGSAYSRRPISVYSEGTRHIVDAMRSSGRSSRLIVVSAGLTYPPSPMNWFAYHLVFPLLRGVIADSLRRHAGDGGVSPDGPRHRLDRGPTRKTDQR